SPTIRLSSTFPGDRATWCSSRSTRSTGARPWGAISSCSIPFSTSTISMPGENSMTGKSLVLAARQTGIRAAAALLLLVPAAVAQERVDHPTIARIREEGLTHSRVLQTFNHLTNVIGPRLTGSPGFRQAVGWTSAELRGYGLANVHEERWPFGRG